MLFHDAALSYLHFVFAFILVGALVAEAFVLRLPVDGRVARLLLRIDLFYAIAAVGVIVAGVSRVFWGAKGADFYADAALLLGQDGDVRGHRLDLDRPDPHVLQVGKGRRKPTPRSL